MNGLLTHMHVTVEAIPEALASMDTATLESWRPVGGTTRASAETFLAVLVVDDRPSRSTQERWHHPRKSVPMAESPNGCPVVAPAEVTHGELDHYYSALRNCGGLLTT
jgi:hypothetical protein